jgi:hypothetical protein
MSVDGWHPDPFGMHEERLFAHGEPTPVVRDQGIGSLDAPPAPQGEPEAEAAAPGSEGATSTTKLPAAAAAASVGAQTGAAPAPRRPTKPMVTIAALLIGVGVIVGILGLTGVGNNKSATPTTTLNPLVQAFLHLPPPTTQVAPTQPASPPTTALNAIERELQAIPRSTTTVPTTPPATSPSTTKPRTPSTTFKINAATRPAPAATPVVVPTTTLPLTTMTTSVGQADQGWYLAYGSVFNTLQTDIEKLNRSLDSTSQASYATVHPYWQELFVDTGYAISLPPIPDAATESQWAAALGDLSAGSTESIAGTGGATGTSAFVTATLDQGTAFVTTGTTQLDGALKSLEGIAATTSAVSRSQVRSWNQAHGAVFSTLQTDISKLDAAFASGAASNFSTVAPSWQQLLSDAQNAIKLAAIPDPMLQSYWSTTLNDLIQGSTDTLGGSEALPPNLFDQGVASIETGATYLNTTLASVQALVG